MNKQKMQKGDNDTVVDQEEEGLAEEAKAAEIPEGKFAKTSGW